MSGRTWTGLAAMFLGGGLIVAQLTVPARATAPPSPTSTPPSSPGQASASAAVLGVVPEVSNLTLAVTFGQSLAAYLQNEAQASASTVNLGGVGALIVASAGACGGIKPDQLPTPLTTDSESGSSHKTTGATFGVETVSASKSPETASATTNVANLSVPGLLTVSATTTSDVHFVAGGYQLAEASVTEAVDILNGLVRLNGITWSSTQRVGKSPVSQSSFSLGPVMIGPLDIPLPSNESIAAALKAINAVTSEVGLTVGMPTVTAGPAPDTTTVGPLELRFSGSPLDNSLASPLNSPAANLEQELVAAGNAAGTSGCSDLSGDFYTADTGVNLVLGALEGSGAVNVDIGGATAQTAAAANYTSPFGGTNQVSLPLASSPLPDGSASPAFASPPATGTPLASPTSTTPAPVSPTTPAATTVAAVCRTTSPAGSPSCWGGAGPVAGGAIVVLGAGLVAADLRRSRGLGRRHGLRRLDQ